MSLHAVIDELDPRTAVVTLEGPLTLGTNLRIAEGQMQGLLDRGIHRLVLDLASVPHCDSSGLGMVIHILGVARQKGGMLRLCSISDKVALIFKMTKADTLVPIDADRASSIAAIPAA